MPLSSYRVLSPAYIAPPHSVRVQPKKIAIEDNQSMQGGQPNVAAGFFKPGIVNINGIPFVESRTSNKRYLEPAVDYFKQGHGYLSQQADYEIDGMKAAGEDVKPAMFNIIPKMPDFALIASPRSRMDFPNNSTPVNLQTSHDIVNAVNPNRLGYFQSKLAKFEGDLKNLKYDETNRLNYEPVEWVNFLAKKGFSIDTTPNPGIIGLGVEKGDFLASYYPNKGYLIREENFQKKAKDLISKYGLTDREAVEAMKRSVLLHEFAHVLGVRGDRKSEKLQGKLQAEFYSMMAERFKGTTMERIYRALAQEGRYYAKDYSFWGSLLERMTEDSHSKTDEILEQIYSKFVKEARALELKGEEFSKYVNERMVQTYGAIVEGEPSYKPSRNNSKSKTSNSKKLEEIVDESDKVSFAITEDGTLAPTYEGRRVYGEGASMPTRFIGRNIKESKNEDGEAEKTYERRLGKSEYKSMKDAKEREAKSEKESPREAETAEASASN
ncbi:hypothetical protein HYX03_00205 [Candidatus Woesearchaeota archaeon]|nr:hypothetical protein [Candidatus Woesearchaeota archaeon]